MVVAVVGTVVGVEGHVAAAAAAVAIVHEQ